MKQITMQGYERVTKTKARKLFADDITIRIVPCKYRPDNQWITFDFNRKQWEAENMETGERVLPNWCFDNFCTRWTYYNGNYELGYYPAFYIKS